MADPVLCVLVAHASGSRVDATLRSLAQQTYPDIEVVVVTVGSVAVPAAAPRVRTVVEAEPGTSFPDAVRLALGRVTDVRASFVLLLHDDVELEPETVWHMVDLARREDNVAAVGCKLVEWDAPEVLQEVGGGLDRFAIRRSALDVGEVDHGQRDDALDVLFCSDACLLVTTQALAEIGGLDPRAWPLYEDVDLCWRLRASGRRVVVSTQTRVRHAAALHRGTRTIPGIDVAAETEHGRLRFIFRHYALMGLFVLLPQLAVTSIAKIAAAVVRREFWKVRGTVGAWTRVMAELPRLAEARRASAKRVDDRELLGLGARGAALERRGERAESLARAGSAVGAVANRMLAQMRDPAAWAGVAAAVVLVAVLRDVLFGATFALGELRALPAFSDALSSVLGRVRPEGLDPFGPAPPGIVVLGALRSLALTAPIAEKLALLLPVVIAAAGGARLGRVLDLGARGRRLLAIAGAVNPVTLALLRDGELGALVTWTASLWTVAWMLEAPDPGPLRADRIRFAVRWALGWALVAALHPAGLVWLTAVGVAVALAAADGRSARRLRAVLTGVAGAVVLLAPWSFEWFTSRSPLVGRPGWLVVGGWSGLEGAGLGAGWPFLVWLAVAVAGAYLVGISRLSVAFVLLATGAFALGAGGAMPTATMLAGAGTSALVLVALASQRISGELPRFELGSRHALVIAGTVVLGAVWLAAALGHVAGGVRDRRIPLLVSGRERVGRVLWLTETSGGLRSWTTRTFSSRLSAFPASGGPADELVAEAVEAARGGRTHRAGGVLALADVSHVVVLDEVSVRGLDRQADLAPLEVHEDVVLYRNDAWQGPVMQLASVPHAPLTPAGLAEAVRSPAQVVTRRWPSGRMTLERERAGQGVVYVAGGPRRGWRIGDADATITAAGVAVDARLVKGRVPLRPPAPWRFLVPITLLLAAGALVLWAGAVYLSRPVAPDTAARPPPTGAVPPRFAAAAPVVLLVGAAALGWTGAAVSAGGDFLSAAWYCPPVGADHRQTIGIANANDVDVEFQVREDLSTPPTSEGVIATRSRETVSVDSTEGAVVESFGRRLAVATAVQIDRRRDSSLCSSHAREVRFFPEGGRAATRARPRLFERYVIYNPFADVARASVRFVSPDESIAPPALQDVQVEPGTAVTVNPEEQFEPMLDLSTIVRVWQGRAIVARRLGTVEQLSWSIGTDAMESGVLPRAATQDAITALIAVNPSDEEAELKIVGAGRRGSIAPQTLRVPANGRSTFEVNVLAPDAAGLVVQVEATRPLGLESLVLPEVRREVSLLPPVQPDRRWVIPIAEERELVLVNPNPREVHVEIDRLGPGSALGSVTVASNRMRVVRLAGSGSFGVTVRADQPITAIAVGEAGTVPGVPSGDG